MRMCRRIALLTLPLIIAGRGGRSQEEVPAVQTEVVRVDVVVTDADGKLVRDLAREDFEVLEDGKPQRITQFLVAGTRSAAVPKRASAPGVPRRKVRARPARPNPVAYIVVVVDDLHIDRANLDAAKEALRAFVDELMGAPDDSVAIVTTAAPGGIRTLTQDRAVLRQAIAASRSREAVVAPARGSQMTPAQAELILRGDQNALQLATRMLMDEPGSVLDSRRPRATVEAAAAHPGGRGPRGEGGGAGRPSARPAVLAEALRFSETTLSASTTCCAAWPRSPDASSACWSRTASSSGRARARSGRGPLREVVDAATRSGAVVYALDARGLAPTGADAGVGGAAAPPGLRERVARLASRRSRARRSRAWRTTPAGSWCAGRTSSLPASAGCWRTTRRTT